MIPKTIKIILRNKIRSWTDSIEDEAVRELAKQNTIVSGGAIVSMLSGEELKDFDIYFRNAETVYAVADYYINLFKKNPPPKFKDEKGTPLPIYLANRFREKLPSRVEWLHDVNQAERRGEEPYLRIIVQSQGFATSEGTEDYQYFESVPDAEAAGNFIHEALEIAKAVEEDKVTPPPADGDKKEEEAPKRFQPKFISGNAITLSNKIQITTRFFGEPDQIHANYDFEHCKCYWQSWDGYLSTPSSALLCIMNKQLVYSGSRFPLCSLFRVRKFSQRGWQINAGQILKMALQCSKLDFSNPNVLEDQLIGVDTAYFNQIITWLREHMEKEKKSTIDQTYLLELVDRLF